MNRFIDKHKEQIKILTVITIYALVLLPYIYTIFYSLPTSDDFCMTIDESGSLFILSLKYAGMKWVKWSGEFFYFFLQYFINPLAYKPLDSFLYGIVMCVFFILFITSLSYLNYSLMRIVFQFKNRFYILLLNILLVSVLLFANNYHEVFYWFVGGFYSIEYAFLYLYIGIMLRYFSVRLGEKRYYIYIVVLGILLCNAVNMCVITAVCYLTIVYGYVRREGIKPNCKLIFPLVIFILVGCITVFAPGNFSRQHVNGGGTIVLALLRTISNNVRRISQVFGNPVIFFMFISLFIIGMIANNKRNKTVPKLWFVLPILAIVLYGTLLPVAIGYGKAGILNNRVCFLLDAIFIPTLCIFIFWLGMYVSQSFTKVFSNNDLVLIILVMVVAFYSLVIKDYGYVRCEYTNQISNLSKVRQERELWVNIYNEIYNSTDSDVELFISDDRVIRSGVIENPLLDEDPDFWINGEICRYFNKEKIIVNMNEDADK